MLRPSRSFIVISGVVVLGGMTACAGGGDAAEPRVSSTTAASVGPGARSAPELAYDPERQQVLMINGEAGVDSAGSGLPAVLWAFDGSRWMKIADGGPAPRSLGAVAYDRVRGHLIVAGGLVGDTAVTDTWEWDGTSWTDRQADLPGGTSNHLAGTYDLARQQMVAVFGQNSDLVLATTTLGWDGRHWSTLATEGPPPRAHYAIGYDPVREVVVLFGGYAPGAGEKSDTWEWDGATWTEVRATGPSPRSAARMAYDPGLDAMLLFGGGTGSRNYYDDTWAWDGVEWSLLAEDGPSARGFHGMAYDEARSTMVLFGGYDGGDLGDTWEWRDRHWTQVA